FSRDWSADVCSSDLGIKLTTKPTSTASIASAPMRTQKSARGWAVSGTGGMGSSVGGGVVSTRSALAVACAPGAPVSLVVHGLPEVAIGVAFSPAARGDRARETRSNVQQTAPERSLQL